jgi:hypothetical protein
LAGWQPEWETDWQAVRARRFAQRRYTTTVARCGIAANEMLCGVETVLADTAQLQADLDAEYRKFVRTKPVK